MLLQVSRNPLASAEKDACMTEAPSAVFLADYQPFTHLVDTVDLIFRLNPKATRVSARIAFRPNPERPGRHALRLDGEGLKLLWRAINGNEIKPDRQAGSDAGRQTLPDGPFTLETEVEIAPEGNTALEGLYMSNGMYCTQCEAEGFRKITFYPDRPDVMARVQGADRRRSAGAAVERQSRSARARAGRNGMTPGRSLPICSRWSRAICARIRTSSPPSRAARSS